MSPPPIKVTLDADNKLNAEVTYSNTDDTNNKAKFENTYNAKPYKVPPKNCSWSKKRWRAATGTTRIPSTLP